MTTRSFLNHSSVLYRVQAMADIIGWIAFSAYVLCAVIMTGVVMIVVGGVSWALWSDFRDFVGSIIDDGKLLEFGGIALLVAFTMWAVFVPILAVEILKNSGAPACKISISRAARWMGVCLAAVPLWPAAAVFVAQLWSSADFTAFVVAAGTVIQFAVLVVVAVYALVPFLPPDGGAAAGLAAPGNNEPVVDGSVADGPPATRVELEDLVAVNTELDILEPV